jgi:hypothetical protein
VPRWRQGRRRLPRVVIGLSLIVLAGLVFAVVSRPAVPTRPVSYDRAEQLREEKRVPAQPSPNTRALAGAMGVCLAASLALGWLTLTTERRGRRASSEDVSALASHPRLGVRLGYACAGACFGVATSLAIVLGVQSRVAMPGSATAAIGARGDAVRSEAAGAQADPAVREVRPRPEGSRPGAATTQARPADGEGTAVRAALNSSTVARPAPAKPRVDRPARSAGRADDPRRVVPETQVPPVSTEPLATPASPTTEVTGAAPSTGEPSAEPEASASPATPVQILPAPAAEPPKTETPTVETATLDAAALREPPVQSPEHPIAAAAEPDRRVMDKIRGEWKSVTGKAKAEITEAVRTLRDWLSRD